MKQVETRCRFRWGIPPITGQMVREVADKAYGGARGLAAEEARRRLGLSAAEMSIAPRSAGRKEAFVIVAEAIYLHVIHRNYRDWETVRIAIYWAARHEVMSRHLGLNEGDAPLRGTIQLLKRLLRSAGLEHASNEAILRYMTTGLPRGQRWTEKRVHRALDAWRLGQISCLSDFASDAVSYEYLQLQSTPLDRDPETEWDDPVFKEVAERLDPREDAA